MSGWIHCVTSGWLLNLSVSVFLSYKMKARREPPPAAVMRIHSVQTHAALHTVPGRQHPINANWALILGFPGGTDGKGPACKCGRCKRCGFHSWVGKIPWRRTWQPTPGFLPGDCHGQRSLQAMVHRVAQSWTRLKQLSTHAQALILIVIPFGRQQKQPQTGSITFQDHTASKTQCWDSNWSPKDLKIWAFFF